MRIFTASMALAVLPGVCLAAGNAQVFQFSGPAPSEAGHSQTQAAVVKDPAPADEKARALYERLLKKAQAGHKTDPLPNPKQAMQEVRDEDAPAAVAKTSTPPANTGVSPKTFGVLRRRVNTLEKERTDMVNLTRVQDLENKFAGMDQRVEAGLSGLVKLKHRLESLGNGLDARVERSIGKAVDTHLKAQILPRVNELVKTRVDGQVRASVKRANQSWRAHYPPTLTASLLNPLRGQLRDAQVKIKEIENQRNTRIEAVRQSVESKVSALGVRLSGAEKQGSKLESSIGQMAEKVDGASVDRDALRVALKSQGKAIAEGEKAGAHARSQLARSITRLDKTQSKLSARMQGELVAVKQSNEALRASVSQLFAAQSSRDVIAVQGVQEMLKGWQARGIQVNAALRRRLDAVSERLDASDRTAKVRGNSLSRMATADDLSALSESIKAQMARMRADNQAQIAALQKKLKDARGPRLASFYDPTEGRTQGYSFTAMVVSAR